MDLVKTVDCIYELKIHGRIEYFGFNKDGWHIPDYHVKKKVYYWHPTIVTDERVKKMRLISIVKILNR